ncbi:hypothetical protein F5J12DRAFT_782142 [Pisolithus orientalis]|uniref:uncharacterized protein n=1 Tax=Pisolithus orientalis TaxID=936130 RepID=UPI00222530FA|nr:uncharacterized protein F5J12DRAFT_782142 [Pisolithus orientalis]KAI6009651.1 hypothetical protein F5J12DRAFT_782142 [Pisolithus orientalis]
MYQMEWVRNETSANEQGNVYLVMRAGIFLDPTNRDHYTYLMTMVLWTTYSTELVLANEMDHKTYLITAVTVDQDDDKSAQHLMTIDVPPTAIQQGVGPMKCKGRTYLITMISEDQQSITMYLPQTAIQQSGWVQNEILKSMIRFTAIEHRVESAGGNSAIKHTFVSRKERIWGEGQDELLKVLNPTSSAVVLG